MVAGLTRNYRAHSALPWRIEARRSSGFDYDHDLISARSGEWVTEGTLHGGDSVVHGGSSLSFSGPSRLSMSMVVVAVLFWVLLLVSVFGL